MYSWCHRSLLFPEKEAKSVSSASQKPILYQLLGEADPGDPGLTVHIISIFLGRMAPISGILSIFHQEKKQSPIKRAVSGPKTPEADPGRKHYVRGF
jgi:hypothetical protein